MKKEAIYDIAHCYQNGDLENALMEAAAWVKELGEDRVVHVIARLDENIPGAWWVDVIYRVKQ
ncbi:MAG: hypothetical protein KAX65_00040 [Caldilineaceae bacterium]|nr:hypothetical protein [Caldilineaceae bacterium]